jgi:hypothetical protein
MFTLGGGERHGQESKEGDDAHLAAYNGFHGSLGVKGLMV